MDACVNPALFLRILTMKKTIFFLLAALSFTAASAHDLSVHIKALNGDDIPNCADGKAGCGRFMTVADVAMYALLNAPEGRPGGAVTADDKMRRFLLAAKIQGNAHVILAADEVSMIETSVAATFGPLYVGRVNQAIDPGQAVKK
jgi:hypothetical protein